MTRTRSVAMTAVAAAAALTATGITYAAAAPAPQAAAPAALQAPAGGDTGNRNEGNHNEGKHHENNDHRRGFHRGWIHINERTYSAHPNGCITVVSGLGSKSFNIRNDSRKTVEFFRGATCDNGAPVAVIGPRSSSNGVQTCTKDQKFGRGGRSGRGNGVEAGNGFDMGNRSEGSNPFAEGNRLEKGGNLRSGVADAVSLRRHHRHGFSCFRSVQVRDGVVGSFRVIKRHKGGDHH